MLQKLGSSVRQHLKVRERQSEKKTKKKTLALQKHRPNEERRGGGGDTSAQHRVTGLRPQLHHLYSKRVYKLDSRVCVYVCVCHLTTMKNTVLLLNGSSSGENNSRAAAALP